MSANQEKNDLLFDSLCFLALRKQLAESSSELAAKAEVENLNRELIENFRAAADNSLREFKGADVLDRVRRMLGTNVALGLFRKPKGAEIPDELDDEIERSIEEQSKSGDAEDEKIQ